MHFCLLFFGIQNLAYYFFVFHFMLLYSFPPRNEERKKLSGFSYSKNMANFEAFLWSINLSISLLFLKGAIIQYLCDRYYIWFVYYYCLWKSERKKEIIIILFTLKNCIDNFFWEISFDWGHFIFPYHDFWKLSKNNI